MTQNIEDLHVYLRSIRPNERTSLSVLASLVHEGATVLDLGCGSGALGQYLRETHRCTCDGLTWSEAEAALARPHYRHVVVADLEACDLLTTFTAQHYDYIVCADVLEHLRAPERVLAACRDLLKPSGRLLISVPNAGYAGLVAELLQGEFRYREEGLLDRTHLRFFTRRSLARFMGEQRWAVDSLDTIHREMPESEFKTQFDQLPPSVARYLLAAPDALTYQFVGAAHPVDMAAPEQLDTPPTAEAQALFTAQLYLGQGGSYAEDRKLTARGIIGQERQTLRFPIAAAEAPTTHLRLDPADRPGFLHLYAISLRDDQGVERWRWDASSATGELLSEALHRQMEWQSPLAPAAPASLLLLTGDDPWFQLPVDPQTVADATTAGGSLEVEVGWPMSADYLALSATVRPLQDQIDQTQRLAHAAQDRLKGEMGHLESQLSETRDALAVAHGANARLHETNDLLMAQRSELREESSRLQRNAARQHYDLARLQNDFSRLQAEHGALVAQFKTLENSLVYRATRPLASAKRGLNQLLGRTAAPSPAAALPSQHPLPPTPHPVDVIVPVYRGLADTQLCIDSVLASPLRAAYRLIVINDCSPEPEVTQWLRERAAQDARITLLENSENLGFVGTVNRGMALSDSNDVLLLNSDTEVANDWLDRIRAAAYGDARIASVTPLSTNATICSYPRFCEDNPLPPGYDTARLDALCARTNPGVVVDVPTGVGFCMYIRRDSLHALGLFDTEHFGKGYGEENDFCQRAVHAGWRNLHLLDTFVLHTGGVSFGDSKSPRERAAMETLARLHPNYARDVHAFVQADPARPYRLALDVARILDGHLPVVLAVLHDRAGGTVRHVRELSTHLAAHAQFLTLTPAPGHSVALRMASEREGFELCFRLDDQFDELLGVLRSLGVCHVHYHHLLGHGQQVRDLPALLDVPYDFTAHDFYSYCTHITLTGDEERFTGDAAPGQCNCCTPDMASPMGGSVAQWRSANALLLNGARHVFAPSHDTARRIAGLVPAAKVLAVPHTDVAPDTDLPAPQPRPLPATQALKVVVIGALSVIKGADVLEAVAREAAKRQAPVEFHLLGYAYRQLQTQPKAHLTVHGAYTEEDLPRLLAWLQPDIVWFPAQWPETYSYTLSAALQAGLPVAVPDIGAFAERVATRPWSWVCDWNLDTKQWVEFFTTLRTEHFAQAIPPALPAVQTVDPVQSQPDAWGYRSDYVTDLPPRRAEGAGLDHAQLLRYLPTPTPTAAARSRLFSALVYLRSLPVLRSVARRIPAHWQRKVKSRLIA